MRQYGREDVEYASFYSSWMKDLAQQNTMPELETMLYGAAKTANVAARQHLAAIERTGSMQGNSSARAHRRNVTAAAGELRIAVAGAIEIHDLFPEHAKAS